MLVENVKNCTIDTGTKESDDDQLKKAKADVEGETETGKNDSNHENKVVNHPVTLGYDLKQLSRDVLYDRDHYESFIPESLTEMIQLIISDVISLLSGRKADGDVDQRAKE